MPHNQILLLEYYTQVTQLKDVLEGFFFLKIPTKSNNTSNNKTNPKPHRRTKGFQLNQFSVLVVQYHNTLYLEAKFKNSNLKS